jgi:hypothetical protein
MSKARPDVFPPEAEQIIPSFMPQGGIVLGDPVEGKAWSPRQRSGATHSVARPQLVE